MRTCELREILSNEFILDLKQEYPCLDKLFKTATDFWPSHFGISEDETRIMFIDEEYDGWTYLIVDVASKRMISFNKYVRPTERVLFNLFFSFRNVFGYVEVLESHKYYTIFPGVTRYIRTPANIDTGIRLLWKRVYLLKLIS